MESLSRTNQKLADLGRLLQEVNALTWERWPLAVMRRRKMDVTTQEWAAESASRRRTAQLAAAMS
jgi:hypothetical protein